MMPPRIVTLTMNPAVDVSADVDEVVHTHKLRCSSGVRDPGGGGINVARVMHRLGFDTVAVYPAGGVMGQVLDNLLDAESVAHVTVPIAGETREDFNVTARESGDQFRFVLEGPTLSAREADACLDAVAGSGACAFLVASGSLPPGVADDFYRRLVPVADALGAKLVVDTSGVALRGALGKGVYLIKPSLRELEGVAHGPLRDTASRIGAARKLIAEGKSEIVALTLGADGALAITAKAVWQANAPAVRVTGTVGSGDSFLAAMLGALAKGASLEEALRRGVAAGGAALLAPGTKLCRAQDIDILARDVRVTPVQA